MKKRIIILGVILTISFSSCIKEIRGDCPCFLSIDFSKVNPQKVESIQVWFADSLRGMVRCDTIDKSEYLDFYEVKVPKGTTFIYCWGNISSYEIDGNISPQISPNLNKGCGKLYFYKNRISSAREFAQDTVRMKREYLGLNVKILGNVKSTSGFSISIESSSAGYYINGEVLEGSFRLSPDPKMYPAQVKDYYEYDFNITRQKRLEDLRLFLVADKNGVETLLYNYPLGETLSKMGVDMNAEELGDISLTIDFSYLETKIIIEGWNGSQKIEIII